MTWIDEAPPAAALPEPGASALYVVDLYNRMRRYFAVPDGPRWAWRRMHDWAERLLRERRPTHVACASDNPWPTRQHLAAPGRWKAGRTAMPASERAALLEQVRVASEALWDGLGVRTFSVRGHDGDDVAASLVEVGLGAGLPVVAATNDKDWLQLVEGGDRTVLAWDGEFDDPVRGTKARVLGPDGVREVLSVWPWQVVDRMALVGKDAPGVEGIGEKSATAIVREFGGLDAALASLDAVEPAYRLGGAEAMDAVRAPWDKIGARYGAALRDGRDDALLSRELVRLRRDVDLGLASADDLRV